VHVTVAFAPGETTRTLLGYSPDPVAMLSASGGTGVLTWDPATSLFTVEVTPGNDGTASLQLSRGGNPLPPKRPGRPSRNNPLTNRVEN
jgi:hypothetical protein